VLWVLALVAWRHTRTSLVGLVESDVKGLMTRPALFAALILAGTAALAALVGLVPSYWRTPGWSDLPKLATGRDENGHHWIGAQDPKVTIVEFSDYECPHCRAAHKATRALAAKHPDQIRLVHRHLPLDMACHPSIRRPFHKRACFFAEAAECAGRQGRFWEMNDAIYSIQETVKTETVDPLDLAVRLGLNRPDFKRCIENHETAERIAADAKEGVSHKLRGTPSFLIGERVFLGRIPEGELDPLLKAGP
jgi:protein-disulfide isomerase